MKKTGKLRVPYAATIYGKEEVRAVVKVFDDPLRLAAGERVKTFEEKIAKLFGKRHGLMVNSGSSANLIALESLQLPSGAEVITPALTFGTTLAPIVQKGLTPVFADVEEGTYLMNLDQVEEMITSKTRAIMIPSLLGNIPDMERLQKMAKHHDLVVIEDSCDTLGATFAGKPTGVYTDVSTTSFYASHIITAAAGGGMVLFRDDARALKAKVLANWGRQSTLFGFHQKSEDIAKRFSGELDGEQYDAKFIFTEIGYNFQASEIHAAFGLEQLKRLKRFTALRQKNFAELTKFFKRYEQYFILPVQHPKVKTNWLAYPLTIRSGAPFTRNELTRYLEERNIQTRPVFTGNVLKQPAYRDLKNRKIRKEGYPVADYVMRNAFVVGSHHGLTREQLNYLKEQFEAFLGSHA